jgi:DNA topoisomerase VI subunit A
MVLCKFETTCRVFLTLQLPFQMAQLQRLQQQCSLERRRRALLEHDESVFKMSHKCPQEIVSEIENLVLGIAISTAKGEKVNFQFPNLADWESVQYSPDLGHLRLKKEAKKVSIERGSFRFEVLMKILLKIHQMLLSNCRRTLRDIYYTDVPFFKNQDVVNDAFNDISCLLATPRWSLNCV